MIRNHILLAVRNIAKHKLFSLINIAGLSLGLTAAIILFLFARYQLTYDQYHSNADNLYIVYKERITPTGTQPTYDTWHPLLGQLKADFPEVKTGTRINESGVMVEANGNRFSESCYYVDPAYFNVFDFPLALGDNNNPLPTKNSAIISQELAKKFFGEENPIGKPLIINFEKQYTVSGVLKEYPQNSSIASELIFPIQSQSDYAYWENDWDHLPYLLLFNLMRLLRQKHYPQNSLPLSRNCGMKIFKSAPILNCCPLRQRLKLSLEIPKMSTFY